MVNEKRARSIDFIMKDLGFKRFGDKKVKNYEYLYSAVETDIQTKSITRALWSVTYDVTFWLSSDEWSFRFDKVGFEIKIRDIFKAQCKYAGQGQSGQGFKKIKYTITTLEMRR